MTNSWGYSYIECIFDKYFYISQFFLDSNFRQIEDIFYVKQDEIKKNIYCCMKILFIEIERSMQGLSPKIKYLNIFFIWNNMKNIWGKYHE